jgi:hypothetical protein
VLHKRFVNGFGKRRDFVIECTRAFESGFDMAKQTPSRIKNLTLAGISALAGLVALAVIFVALMFGLWIDSHLGRRGPATVLLLVCSVPVSLFLMTRMALGLVARIAPPAPRDWVEESSHQEEE